MARRIITHKAKAFDSEHPLFILYTSGSTGKPKGVLHTSAGYLLGAKLSSHYVFDLKENDRLFLLGRHRLDHRPQLRGLRPPLERRDRLHLRGRAQPARARPFLADDRPPRLTILYTAPTAIRAFMRWGDNYVLRHRLDSLRLLGSVGEPINPEAWMWYHTMIGKKRCPIVDTWWQTETGSIMITPMPGITPTKPGSARGRSSAWCRRSWTRRRRGAPQQRRQARHHQALALDAPHALGRRRPLQEAYWSEFPASRPDYLLHGRRRAAGQGRLLLDRRPHRRRAQRLRPPHRHRRGRERARVASGGRRGRRGRPPRRTQGSGARGVCDRSRHGIAPPTRSRSSSAPTSARRSARSRSPTRCALPPACRRRGPEKSCAVSSRSWPPPATSRATRRRLRISRSSPHSRLMRSKNTG